jgi:hypothetical protein
MSMKNSKLIVLALATIVSFVLAGQTLTRGPEHVPSTRYGARFTLAGTNYGSFLVRRDILASPSWSPSEPLPLSISRAVAIAEGELHKLVAPEKGFYLKEVTLSCVGHTHPQDAYTSWYYLVYFEPIHPSPGKIGLQERVGIAVDLQGHPGAIEPTE